MIALAGSSAINVQQKKLEELIFTLDPEAFVIFENTFNVIGKGFSRRKVY